MGKRIPAVGGACRGGLGRRGWGVALCAVLLMTGCGPKEPSRPATRIIIESAPEAGAAVLVAGEDRGTTPVTVEGLPPGKYEVLLTLDRYKRTFSDIVVKGEPEETFTVAMEPLMGTVSVESKPIGADIYVDGKKVGSTPVFGYPLQVGDYSYELRLENYYPVTNAFTIEENFKLEFKHELKPMEAQMEVFSRPTGAKIWINNVAQAQTTPSRFTLFPGNYLVSVHTPGFVQEEKIVTLAANATETVQLQMSPGAVPPGMVLIPGGPFTMGNGDRAPDERPKRVVDLKPYYMDKFEVTNQEYKAVFPDHSFPEGQENWPATGVSWSQAMRYASLVGKRLPTEEEWEKAARGADAREYPWGWTFEEGMANTKEAGHGRRVRVGFHFNGTSPYRCMDMAGNAYEWVSNWYDAYPGNRDVTKDYGQIFRVLRGGSYLTGKFEARCASRHFDRMDATREDYGFRCAQDAPAQ